MINKHQHRINAAKTLLGLLKDHEHDQATIQHHAQFAIDVLTEIEGPEGLCPCGQPGLIVYQGVNYCPKCAEELEERLRLADGPGGI